MARISDEELKKRKARLGQAAHSELVKSGVVHFRLEPQNIEKIYEVAASKKIRMGQMVRDWVLERLAVEIDTGARKQASQSMVSEIIATTSKTSRADSLDRDDLMLRLRMLERLVSAQADRIDRLESSK